jgi:hypothetical protein
MAWVGLRDADDRVDVVGAVAALHGHGGAEVHDAVVAGRLDHLGAVELGAEIADAIVDGGDGGGVAGRRRPVDVDEPLELAAQAGGAAGGQVVARARRYDRRAGSSLGRRIVRLPRERLAHRPLYPRGRRLATAVGAA